MSQRKNQLLKASLVSAGDMTGNITSSVLNCQYLDNIGIQINFTGTPVGTFAVQISADHAQDQQGNVTVAGSWVSLTLSPSPAATGSADQIYIDMTQLSAPWLRVVYTATSSTGVLNVYATGKML